MMWGGGFFPTFSGEWRPGRRHHVHGHIADCSCAPHFGRLRNFDLLLRVLLPSLLGLLFWFNLCDLSHFPNELSWNCTSFCHIMKLNAEIFCLCLRQTLSQGFSAILALLHLLMMAVSITVSAFACNAVCCNPLVSDGHTRPLTVNRCPGRALSSD